MDGRTLLAWQALATQIAVVIYALSQIGTEHPSVVVIFCLLPAVLCLHNIATLRRLWDVEESSIPPTLSELEETLAKRELELKVEEGREKIRRIDQAKRELELKVEEDSEKIRRINQNVR